MEQLAATIDGSIAEALAIIERQVRPDANGRRGRLVVTGVGKSGLGRVLTGAPFVPTESTHGHHVWTLDSGEAKPHGQRTLNPLVFQAKTHLLATSNADFSWPVLQKSLDFKQFNVRWPWPMSGWRWAWPAPTSPWRPPTSR